MKTRLYVWSGRSALLGCSLCLMWHLHFHRMVWETKSEVFNLFDPE